MYVFKMSISFESCERPVSFFVKIFKVCQDKRYLELYFASYFQALPFLYSHRELRRGQIPLVLRASHGAEEVQGAAGIYVR